MDAIGSTTKPIYIDSDGAAKPLTGPIGSATQPIYMNNSGQLVAGNSPVYSVHTHTSESFMFEALDGSTVTKTLLTS